MVHRRLLRLRAGWVAVGAAVAFAGCAPPAQQQAAGAPEPDPAAKIERGRYLVTAGGCSDCHTPWKMGPSGPEPDGERLLSGHPADLVMPPAPELPPGPWLWVGAATNTAYAGPWGVSYAANLTPDPETGIGGWQEQTFVQAMRSGRHMGVPDARPILPPMPWPGIGRMTDEDLAAIFAYLQSLPPISNRVPDAVLAPAPSAGTEGAEP
jgi:mono/diheme cytochrome c family protein